MLYSLQVCVGFNDACLLYTSPLRVRERERVRERDILIRRNKKITTILDCLVNKEKKLDVPMLTTTSLDESLPFKIIYTNHYRFWCPGL